MSKKFPENLENANKFDSIMEEANEYGAIIDEWDKYDTITEVLDQLLGVYSWSEVSMLLKIYLLFLVKNYQFRFNKTGGGNLNVSTLPIIPEDI